MLVRVLVDRVCSCYREVRPRDRTSLRLHFSTLITDCGHLMGLVTQLSWWNGTVPPETRITPLQLQKEICSGVQVFAAVARQLDTNPPLKRLEQSVLLLGHIASQEFHRLGQPTSRRLESLADFTRRMQVRMAWVTFILEKKDEAMALKNFDMDALAGEATSLIEHLRQPAGTPQKLFAKSAAALQYLHKPRLTGDYKGTAYGTVWGHLIGIVREGLHLSLAHLVRHLDDAPGKIAEAIAVHRKVFGLVGEIPTFSMPELSGFAGDDRKQLENLQHIQVDWITFWNAYDPLSNRFDALASDDCPLVSSLPLFHIAISNVPMIDGRAIVTEASLDMLALANNCSALVKGLTARVVWAVLFRCEALEVGKVRLLHDIVNRF